MSLRHTQKIKLPNFQALLLPKIKNGRAPASIPTKLAPEQEFIRSHSPKKLYFLTLLTQYQKLTELKQTESFKTPNTCPHFHSTLVEHNEYFPRPSRSINKELKNYKKGFIQTLKAQPDQLAYSPELALPINTDSLRPRVIDLIDSNSENYSPLMTQEMVDQALEVHLSKTQSELIELCEFGSSDNYYIYENLVGKIEREGALQANNFGAQTMLKTSLMFNQALIDSLKSSKSSSVSRTPASTSKSEAHEFYHQESLERLEASWMRSYFSKLARQH